MSHPVTPLDQAVDALPPLHRILTPDEFRQAQGMSPEALATNPFPVIPPAPSDGTVGPGKPKKPALAPADATAASNPNARATPGTPQTGLARILTQYVAEPIMDHPLTTALTTLTPGGPAVMTGLMGRDVLEYAAQKWHELGGGGQASSLAKAPEQQSRDAADATTPRPKISGEQAAVEAALLAAAPLVHAGIKAVKGGEPVVGEPGGPEPAAVAAEGIAPRVPAPGETPTALDLAMAGGNERFSGLPVTAEARAAIKQHVDAVTDAWQKIVAPANRTPEAKQAANILRATTGEMAAQYEQAAFKLDDFRRAIDPLPESDKLGFIDAIEGGRSQASPEFQPVADIIRKTLDDARDQIRALGTGKLDDYIENYFPHIWSDPDRAADVFKTMGAKRPMEGSKSFLKQRTIPTTLEGIQAGLEPVSTNPVDLTLLKLREMQRYLMAHQSLNEMKDAGLVKFVRAGQQAPDGYARINDKIATVFGPREGAVKLPEGANVDPGDVGVYGMRIMGEHWAPEPVVTVVNNYLSPGLRGNPIYDAYRGLGNTLNQAQLGLSAFHLGFTSMDASVSRAALGLEYIASGRPATGLRTLASSPAAPVTNFLLGKRIRAAYLNPDAASPDMLALANAVKEAGGRVRQDSFYKNSAPETFARALKQGEMGTAAKQALPALIQYQSRWLMDHVVPMQKLGVFGDMAQKALAELPPDATLAERRAVLAKAWDSVDNRMGQVVYDNLFWNKTFKDLSMASVRSVGWNLGTIRELGGGIGDIAGNATKALTGKAAEAELTHRAAYVMALPLTVGLYGAVYQLLRTGEPPTEFKDYFFPKTGEVDADGQPERVQLPSYMKDMFAYAGALWETIKHKVSPALSAVYEMLQNENYYGDEIRNPNDPLVRQVAQEAKYVGEQLLPFSLTNALEQTTRGDKSVATRYGNLVGVTPAPRQKVRSDAENLMASYIKHAPNGASPEEVEQRQARAQLLSGLRGVTPLETKRINDAIERGDIVPADLAKLLKRAGMTPDQERFKRLTFAQAVDVFQHGRPEEQAKFAQILLDKATRAAKAASKE